VVAVQSQDKLWLVLIAPTICFFEFAYFRVFHLIRIHDESGNRAIIGHALDSNKNSENTLRSMSIVNAAKCSNKEKSEKDSGQQHRNQSSYGHCSDVCLVQELAQALTSMHRHWEWQIRVPPWNIAAYLLMICQLCTLGLREHCQQMFIAVPKCCR
jgi:hypothetical protein